MRGNRSRSQFAPNGCSTPCPLSPAFWNLNARQQFGAPSTTNACESFHRYQQRAMHQTFSLKCLSSCKFWSERWPGTSLHFAEVEHGKRRVPSRFRNTEKFARILVTVRDAIGGFSSSSPTRGGTLEIASVVHSGSWTPRWHRPILRKKCGNVCKSELPAFAVPNPKKSLL